MKFCLYFWIKSPGQIVDSNRPLLCAMIKEGNGTGDFLYQWTVGFLHIKLPGIVTKSSHWEIFGT